MNRTTSAMATPNHLHPTTDVAGKVLRRAEIAKVARNLQDRLALANFKAQNGWQNRTLRTIEPEVTEQLRRKRPYSSGDVVSDSSSIASEEHISYSSPLTAPAFSDELPRSGRSQGSYFREPTLKSLQNFGSRKRPRSSSNTALSTGSTTRKSWKQSHRLAKSSPVFQRPQLPVNAMQNSFVSDAATIPDARRTRSARFTSRESVHSFASDKDDLPVYSFDQRTTTPVLIASSPPRTPSPTRQRCRPRNSQSAKESGADLLLYLANSPSRSPALSTTTHAMTHHSGNTDSHILTRSPTTPPPRKHDKDQTTLPSACFLSTPTTSATSHNINLPLFSTPGQNFNFADFVNVTPSPAQAPWGGRTPGTLNKTPAARAARRGLNFDSLAPLGGTLTASSGTSPVMQRLERGRGLALELGDKLIPRS